jgi:hypothetical protein
MNCKVYDIGANGISIDNGVNTYISNCNSYAINNEVYNCVDCAIDGGRLNGRITGNYVHDLTICLGKFGKWNIWFR